MKCNLTLLQVGIEFVIFYVKCYKIICPCTGEVVALGMIEVHFGGLGQRLRAQDASVPGPAQAQKSKNIAI